MKIKYETSYWIGSYTVWEKFFKTIVRAMDKVEMWTVEYEYIMVIQIFLNLIIIL